MAPVLVYGSREFGEVVRPLVTHCGRSFHGFVDDWHPSNSGVLGDFDSVFHQCPPAIFEFAIAVGYRHFAARWQLYERLKSAGYRIATLIHPRAYVADSATVMEGCIVMAGAIVDVRARVRELSVLWPGAVINHDSEIAENCFVSPNATVCGFSRVGRSTFIGANAVVVDHTSVPDDSFVKAGSIYKATAKPCRTPS